MNITEVNVELMNDPDDRLRAFCSITLDNAFAVRDLKVIDGQNGLFVAMPSRKITGPCSHCGCKNQLRVAYCNQCGERQSGSFEPKDADPRVRYYADIAHPINSECREEVQRAVIKAYEAEMIRSTECGHVSRIDEIKEPAPGRPEKDVTKTHRKDLGHGRMEGHLPGCLPIEGPTSFPRLSPSPVAD